MWCLQIIGSIILVCLPSCATKFAKDTGEAELQRFKDLAVEPRYGECWSRILEDIDARCKELTADIQSTIALRLTHCHLQRSNRPFPPCPQRSDISSCTRDMDAVAFNTYTEFFTHAHSICHYLQSESWQDRAHSTIHRLTKSSAGVVEQLKSTQRIAEDLVQAQTAALQAQEHILRNGEELKNTLKDSTQGLKKVFSEMRVSAQEQQLAFSEIFNRVAFLQNFILSEAHTLGCILYNSMGVCAAFFLTATQRTSRARLILFGLVLLNIYLEKMIYRKIQDTTNPGYQQMERVNQLVGTLRQVMILLGLLVLVYCALKYRDVSKESLKILAQLKETQSALQIALHQAESLQRWTVGKKQMLEGEGTKGTEGLIWPSPLTSSSSTILQKPQKSRLSSLGSKCDSMLRPVTGTDTFETTIISTVNCNAVKSCHSRPHCCPLASPTVYSIAVEKKKPCYNLRSRHSMLGSSTSGDTI